MKIIRYGELTFREGEGPDIHGWQVEREPEDPTDASTEQLLLGFVIHWAQEKFRVALNPSVMDVVRKAAIKKIRADQDAIDTKLDSHLS